MTELTPHSDRPTQPPRSASPRRKVFRWRGIFALLAMVAIVVAGWLIFGDRVVRDTLEEAATKSLGAQVDIGSLHVDLMGTSLELRDLAVAHPFDTTRDVLRIAHAHVALDADALVEKSIVITDLTIDRIESGVGRAQPARRVAAGGFLPRALNEASKFSSQFKVPILSLTPIDTIKALILDPSGLASVKAAQAVAVRADSLKGDVLARAQRLRLRETADSAEALLASLKGKTPRTLGIAGTRTAVSDVRRLATRIDSIKRDLEGMKTTVRRGVDSLTASVRAVDSARKADYAMARSLLALPTFDAPDIGPALFGKVSIDAFERAMYWIMLARDYAPPGLVPREKPGPQRLRRAGTTVRFVNPTAYPAFHLQRADVTLSLGEIARAAKGEYRFRAADVTSDPALVGRPTRFLMDRLAVGSAVESLTVAATIDHASAVPGETIDVRAGSVALPGFAVPVGGIRVNLGRGNTTLRLSLAGDSVTGRLAITAPKVAWTADTARRAGNALEQLVTRVIAGIDRVEMSTDVRGSITAPRIAVRSNLDREVADNIRRVAGEEVQRAEARARAQVDALADRALAPMRAKIAEAKIEAEDRLRDAQERLDKAKADLAAQLKTLTAGLIGG